MGGTGEYTRCAKCGARRCPVEVKYDPEVKDYVCRNLKECIEGDPDYLKRKLKKHRRVVA